MISMYFCLGGCLLFKGSYILTNDLYVSPPSKSPWKTTRVLTSVEAANPDGHSDSGHLFDDFGLSIQIFKTAALPIFRFSETNLDDQEAQGILALYIALLARIRSKEHITLAIATLFIECQDSWEVELPGQGSRYCWTISVCKIDRQHV